MADIKQYVNLDPDKPKQLDGLDKARAGKRVVFEAKIDRKKAGISVRFTVVRGASNVLEPGTVSKYIATTDGTGKAVWPYDLSEHGGDTFAVKACVDSDKTSTALSSNTYFVWRRIYYQMSRFDAGTPGAGQPGDSLPAVPAFDITAAKTELEARNHNIELVDKSRKALITRYANLLTGQSKSLDYKRSAEDSYLAELEPVTVRIVVVNQIGETKTETYLESDHEVEGKDAIEVPDTLFKDPTFAKDKDWFVSAEWRYHGGVAFSALAAKWLTRTGDRDVEIDFPGAAIATGVNAGKNVDIKLTYRCMPACGNGSSWHNVVYLATMEADGALRTADELTATATHELGHFLNMVPAGQETYYLGSGHQGRHCHTGVNESHDYAGKKGTCIMFGESGAKRLLTFCELCDPSLRKSTAVREGMPKDRAKW